MNIVYLDRKFNDDDLKDAIAKSYGLSRDTIIVAHGAGMQSLFDTKGELVIDEEWFDSSHILEVVELEDDFPTLLTICLRGELNNDEVYTNEMMAAKIAKNLNCNCLVGDYGENPDYGYLLVRPSGSIHWVEVDMDMLDDEYRMVIVYEDENEYKRKK